MKIARIITAPGFGGFFYDDQAPIRAGAPSDGFLYQGRPSTPGFDAIRMPAASLSIGLALDCGHVAWGDMMTVQYCGGSGRETPFSPDAAEAKIREVIEPRLGLGSQSFLASCEVILAPVRGRSLPRSLQYGVSQALLRAVAHERRMTMAEVICEEFRLPVVPKRVPLYAQSGDDRGANVDKMILKGVDILPHGLINSRAKFGEGGCEFLKLVDRVARRVEQIGAPGYHPRLHFDVYGWVGLELGHDISRIADFIARAEEAAAPFALHIESPVDFASRGAQIVGLAAIRDALSKIGSRALVVADEWCNDLDDIVAFAQAGAGHILQIKMPDVGSLVDTIRAAIECHRVGMGAYIGGSCVETDLSARTSAHVAVAVQGDMLLAKPGMGVDEAITIVGNEQSRLLAQLRHRAGLQSDAQKEAAPPRAWEVPRSNAGQS